MPAVPHDDRTRALSAPGEIPRGPEGCEGESRASGAGFDQTDLTDVPLTRRIVGGWGSWLAPASPGKGLQGSGLYGEQDWRAFYLMLVFYSWRRVFPKTDPEVVAITGVIKLGFLSGPKPGAKEIVFLHRNGADLP